MWDVVIVGGGIAGLTAAQRLREEGRHVAVVEGEARPGGKVTSERHGGFLVEGGPDAFITQKPWALELVRELGLEDQLIGAEPDDSRTYVVKDSRLVALPDALRLLVPGRWAPFLGSPLLSWPAKLRVFGERFVREPQSGEDESVADFVRRRFGSEVLERLAEPLLAHIHVADVERMSLRSTYPRLPEIVARHGSLTQGMRAVARAHGSVPAPVFLTLRGGLGGLVERLAAEIPPDRLFLGRRVRAVETVPGSDYRVRLDDGTAMDARAVVLAVPSFVAAELVDGLDAGLKRRFAELRSVSVATISLGYRRSVPPLGHPLAGYGFFVPRSEKRAILACTWTSSKFAGRVPDEEHVLLRAFLGGAHDEEILAADDATLLALARRDLAAILGIRAEPVLERVYRFERGYPQYEVGHSARVAGLAAALPPGLAIAGCAFHGVGLPDCIRSGREAAQTLGEYLAERAVEVDGGILAC